MTKDQAISELRRIAAKTQHRVAQLSDAEVIQLFIDEGDYESNEAIHDMIDDAKGESQ